MRLMAICAAVLVAGVAMAGDKVIQFDSATGVIDAYPQLVFPGGTTNAFDQLSTTNLTMRGNINLNGNCLSGDGDSEGVSVSSDGTATQINGGGDDAFRQIDIGSGTITLKVFTNTTAVGCSFFGWRGSGSIASPDLPKNSYALLQFSGRGWNGSSIQTRASLIARCNQDWLATSNGTYWVFQATPNDATANANAIAINGDKSILFYNTSEPGTPSSGPILYGVSGELWAKDTSGSKAQLTNDDEDKRPKMREENEFAGTGYKVDYLNLADAVQLLCADRAKTDSRFAPYSTNIIDRYSVPVKDFRANEKKRVAEQTAKHQAYLDERANYEAKLATWNMADPKTREAIWGPKPVEPEIQDTEVLPEQPIPIWAAEVQKQFDYKYAVEAPK
jgi:hypothetical protein